MMTFSKKTKNLLSEVKMALIAHKASLGLHIMPSLVTAHSINIIIGFNLKFYFILCYTGSWLHQQPQNDTRLEGLDFRNKQSFTCRGEWEKMPKRRETSITSYKTLTTYNKFYYHLLFVKPVLIFFDFSSLQR